MDPYSHEAYLAWWRENGGEYESYSLAHHAESHMRIAERSSIFPGMTPFEIFDFLSARYGPLLVAEAMRRALKGRSGGP